MPYELNILHRRSMKFRKIITLCKLVVGLWILNAAKLTFPKNALIDAFMHVPHWKFHDYPFTIRLYGRARTSTR
ncbi:hypothetical protein JOE11_002835 [Robbsia andropogonis]